MTNKEQNRKVIQNPSIQIGDNPRSDINVYNESSSSSGTSDYSEESSADAKASLTSKDKMKSNSSLMRKQALNSPMKLRDNSVKRSELKNESNEAKQQTFAKLVETSPKGHQPLGSIAQSPINVNHEQIDHPLAPV